MGALWAGCRVGRRHHGFPRMAQRRLPKAPASSLQAVEVGLEPAGSEPTVWPHSLDLCSLVCPESAVVPPMGTCYLAWCLGGGTGCRVDLVLGTPDPARLLGEAGWVVFLR